MSDPKNITRREFIERVEKASLGITASAMFGPLFKSEIAKATELDYRNYLPDRMAYRRLGKTEMMVSEISLGGAANYGFDKIDDSDSVAYQTMLEELLDKGINFFDTGKTSSYKTEEEFSVLCSPQNRDEVFISTKIDNLTTAGTKAEVEDSLSKMGTDYIDLVYIHNGKGISGTDYSDALICFDAIDELILEGKVRFKGMTSHYTSQLEGLLNNYSDRIDVIMGYYSPLIDWVWGTGTPETWSQVWSIAKTKDVGVVAMKVLASAATIWEDREAKLRSTQEDWARLQPFVDTGATVPQACIRWALSNPNISSAVVGMRDSIEANEDVAAIIPENSRSIPSALPTFRAPEIRQFPIN